MLQGLGTGRSQQGRTQVKLLVCGSRDYSDNETLSRELSEIHSLRPITLLIQGGAKGADTMARLWATRNGIPVREFKADWAKHHKGAGPIRNQQMLDEGKPDEMTAFINKPLIESRGTLDMVKRGLTAGLLARIVGVESSRYSYIVTPKGYVVTSVRENVYIISPPSTLLED